MEKPQQYKNRRSGVTHHLLGSATALSFNTPNPPARRRHRFLAHSDRINIKKEVTGDRSDENLDPEPPEGKECHRCCGGWISPHHHSCGLHQKRRGLDLRREGR